MHRFFYFLFLFEAVILQQNVLSFWSGYIGGEIYLPIILLVISALASGSNLAEGMGFFCGLIWSFSEADSGLPLGTMPLLLTVIGFVLGRFFYSRFSAPTLFVLCGWAGLSTLFYDLGTMALSIVFTPGFQFYWTDFAEVLINMIYTSISALGVYSLLLPLLKKWEWGDRTFNG